VRARSQIVLARLPLSQALNGTSVPQADLIRVVSIRDFDQETFNLGNGILLLEPRMSRPTVSNYLAVGIAALQGMSWFKAS
jgi:hypothetical protein